MPERPPHISLLVERRQSDEANQQIWGLLGDHDDQRPMGKFGQDAEVTPLLFSKDILGFLMTTESQDLGLTSHPKDGYILGVARYTRFGTYLGSGVTVRYDFGTKGKKKKSTMLGFFSFILNRQ